MPVTPSMSKDTDLMDVLAAVHCSKTLASADGPQIPDPLTPQGP
jgi:hypothetical protein